MRPKGERDSNTSHHDRQLKSKSSAIINFTLPGVLFHVTTPCLYPAVIHAWGIQGKNCNLKAWGKDWNPPGTLLEQVSVVWNVEELLRPQGERQSARSEPALVLCSVDVTHVLHMSSVWAQGTPAWHPQVLKSSCSLQCILNSVFIYMFIYSTSSPSENLYKCLIKVWHRYKECATAT